MAKIGKVILDANVIVKYLIEEVYSDNATKLIRDLIHKNITPFAPSFLKLEVYNVIRKKLALKELNYVDALEYIENFKDISINFVLEDEAILDDTFSLAANFKSTQIYDFIYLSLALNLEAVFITADEKLYSTIVSRTEYRNKVMLLKDY